jgi:hypothetical protein
MSAPEIASTWIAAASGLLGAVVGGAVAHLTNRQQLRQASREAEIAREHALKREVYFEAAEGAERGTQFLGSFSRTELSIEQPSQPLTGNPGWVSKVHAVGDLDTIKALDGATEFLFSRSLDLVAKRARLDTLRDETAAVERRVAQLSAHAQQLVAALQAASAPGATFETRALAPQATEGLLAAQRELEALAGEHDRASRLQDRVHRELLMDCMKAVAEYQRLLSQVNVHVRRELGVPLHEEDYLVHMHQTSDRMLARLKQTLDQLGTE